MQPELLSQAEALLQQAANEAPGDAERAKRIMREVYHGQDTQRWALVLNPFASDAVKLAALLHDIERIVNGDEGYKGDHNGPEYEAFKKQHAARSAAYVGEKLALLGIDTDVVTVVVGLILHHDDTGDEVVAMNDPELNTVVAADTFSFFTSIAPDFLRRKGENELRDKIYFMLDKMPASLRPLLRKQNLLNERHGLDFNVAMVIERIKNEELTKVEKRKPSTHER